MRQEIVPHVLMILRSFAPDGPNRIVEALLREWTPARVRVSAVALTPQGSFRAALAHGIARLGGEIHQLPAPAQGLRGLLLGRTPPALAALARCTGANILHAHLLLPDLAARPAAITARLPLLVTEHGLHGLTEKGFLPGLWARRRFAKGHPHRHIIAAISPKVAADLRAHGVPPERIRLAVNGVSINAYQPATHETRPAARREFALPEDCRQLILWAGNFIPRKDPALALAAFAQLRNQRPHAYLVMAGDGPLLPQTAPPGVILPGRIPSIANALRAADAVLHTATEEPFGLTVAEALAAGLPVVARAASGADDLLPPPPAGWRVAGQSPALWAQTLDHALSADPVTTAAIARAHAAARLSAARMAADYLNLYNELLELPT